mmetsp:Transcript_8124/g.24010  ORF Transcript_8124/g.24010 Transcript_8124/m.24010 type:complete len:206 (+) Transcript_8124:3919-4536(+)
MRQYESFQRVRVVAFPIDHVQYCLNVLGPLPVTRSPVISGASSVLGHEQVLGIEQPAVGPGVCHLVDYAGFQIHQKCAGNVPIFVPLVKEDVFPVVRLQAPPGRFVVRLPPCRRSVRVSTMAHTRRKVRRPGCLRLRYWIGMVVIVGLCVVPHNMAGARRIVPRIFEGAIRCDPVLGAKLLPEFPADLISALPHLQCNYFPWHSV